MSLASRSMLVSLSQRMWFAHTADRKLGQQAEAANEASVRTMRVVKQLVPSEYMLPIKRIAIYGREQHDRLTLPGLQKGQQLLATKLFDEYAITQAEIRDQFFAQVKSFADVYPNIVEAAPKRLGKAFRPEDFPDPDKIMSYFDYKIRLSPVPETGNWLLDDVDMEELEKLRNEVTNEQNEMVREATKELVDRTMKVLESLHSQAKAYTEGFGSGGLLKDATINAAKDLAQLLPSLNIGGDPIIDAAAKEMLKNFDPLVPDEVRHNGDIRNKIAKTAARIMKKLEAAQ